MGIERYLIESARKVPNNIALLAPDGTYTYAELNDLTNRLVRYLVRRGVERGDRVVIWGEKSARTVIAMQATMRIGACYVPMDASTPPQRVATVASQVDARLVLMPREPQRDDAMILTRERRLLYLSADLSEEFWRETRNGDDEAEIDPWDSEEIAYMLFTSGSTGVPKGVCISHGNAAAFIEWSAKNAGLNSTDRVANHASFQFDLSVFDLYATFVAGATVVIVSELAAYVPEVLVALLEQHEVTVLYAVPSVYIMLLQTGVFRARLQAVRVAIFAGEPFPMPWLRRLREELPHARLLNYYGPTETNVCTWFEVQDLTAYDESGIPIGTVACGDVAWAVKDDGSIAKQGEEGELLVCGPTIMLGYWGKPRVDRNRPYATGDIVRVGSEGFNYVGRRDAMLKIRGYRVEPGDIEAVLSEHPSVAQAVVVGTGSAIDSRLRAIVVPNPGQALCLAEARKWCATRLPRYMIVDELEILDALPRTVTGKVDRRRLQTRDQ